MKKAFSIILCLILMLTVVFSLAPVAMAATPTFYYVKEATTMMLDGDKGLSGNINIPATWYVGKTASDDTVLNGITYCTVEYNGVIGKVDKSKLSTKSTALSVSPYYFNKQIISVQSADGYDITAYPDAATNSSESFRVKLGSNISFLASTGSNTYLISYVDNAVTKYGYVRKGSLKDVQEILATENPNGKNPDDQTPGNGNDLSPGTEGEGDKNPSNNLLRILLIVAICVLAVFVVFLIFKPSRKKDKDTFYDDYSKPQR